MKNSRIKIAIQKSGRLRAESINFLQSRGLVFDEESNNLIIPCEGREIDIISIRDDDIPEYIFRGAVDFGIVGKNVIVENDIPVFGLENLNFGICNLTVAVPENSDIQTIGDLNGMRIATSYPRILSQFLQKNRIHAAIIQIRGATEITPKLNLADAICDLVQTGRTLKENQIKELLTIMQSQAVLIGAKPEPFNIDL
ncbi:MAG: ATP phosphoribosyltransferase [Candidatus Gracilibacteria bacterium]